MYYRLMSISTAIVLLLAVLSHAQTTQPATIQYRDLIEVAVDNLVEAGATSKRAATVDKDGYIEIRKIGRVQVLGLTPGEAATAVTKTLSDKVTEPNVKVSIVRSPYTEASGNHRAPNDKRHPQSLKSGDALVVRIQDLQRLSMDGKSSGHVNDQGRLELKHVGSFKAAGMTNFELEEAIAKELSVVGTLKKPRITVDIQVTPTTQPTP